MKKDELRRPGKATLFERFYLAVSAAIQLQRAFHFASKYRHQDALEILSRPWFKKLTEYRLAEASIEARVLKMFLEGATGGEMQLASLLRDIRHTSSFNEDEKALLYRYTLALALTYRKPWSEALARATATTTFNRNSVRGTLLSRYDFETR